MKLLNVFSNKIDTTVGIFVYLDEKYNPTIFSPKGITNLEQRLNSKMQRFVLKSKKQKKNIKATSRSFRLKQTNKQIIGQMKNGK